MTEKLLTGMLNLNTNKQIITECLDWFKVYQNRNIRYQDDISSCRIYIYNHLDVTYLFYAISVKFLCFSITELQGQLQQSESNMKRMQEEFKRK